MPKLGDSAQTRATAEELEALLRTGIGGKRHDRPKNQKRQADKARRNR